MSEVSVHVLHDPTTIFSITNATMHLQNTFHTLKAKFLGMIDYWDETLQSVMLGVRENRNRRKRHSEGSQTPLKAVNQIAYEMDVLTNIVDWVEKGKLSNPKPQDIWITPDKVEMGQIKSSGDENPHLYL